jgi:dTDP-4-dehydrorhamnose 3,5-epimerase-like enzyme
LGASYNISETKKESLLHVQDNGDDVFISIKGFTRSLHYHEKKYGQIYTLVTVFEPLLPELEQSKEHACHRWTRKIEVSAVNKLGAVIPP